MIPNAESRNDPFAVLYQNIRIPPDIVIYDFGKCLPVARYQLELMPECLSACQLEGV